MAFDRLFILGTCLASQIAMTNSKRIRDNFTGIVKLSRTTTSKFSTLLTKPGPISERLYYDMHNTIHNAPVRIQQQYYSIVRPMGISEIFSDVRPNDVLMLDFLGELCPTFTDGIEEFQILLGTFGQPLISYWPQWLVDTVTSCHAYQEDMLSPEQRKRRDKQIYKFSDLITNKFGSRVIVIQNLFTNKIYVPELNAIGQQMLIPDKNISVPFITVNADGDESHPNYEFFNRLCHIHNRRLHTYAPHWQYITPDIDKCFTDLNHEYGPHPTHLHMISMPHLVDQFNNIIDNMPPPKIITSTQGLITAP